MNFTKSTDAQGGYVITDCGRDWTRPNKAVTFSCDTETLIYLDGVKYPQKKLAELLKEMPMAEKRKRLSNETWSWQVFTEENGFFMCRNFLTFCDYLARMGASFGWVYNSTFDFAQIDWELLGDEQGKTLWKPHERAEKGKGYNKGQGFTYESIHNDMGARYAYKLWIPYINANRHKYIHAFEIRDFMKFCAGGLDKVLRDLKITNDEGEAMEKLKMDYQAVDVDNLTDEEVAYCRRDVEGLYYAVKKMNETIETQSEGECHIYGKGTNLMTAGGFAKWELLRSIYPNINPDKRLKEFQKEHPINAEQDKFLRENHLYRGGISYVNPVYRGQLLTEEKMGRKMNRYDVNSEYPYAMANIRDLTGNGKCMKFSDYLKMKDKDDYECAMILEAVTGHVKEGYLGFWYNPFTRKYEDDINEEGRHIIYLDELNELSRFYDDFSYQCDYCILWKRGGYVFRDFVSKNYEVKRQAKKDKNATLQLTAKLLLNSSYGKLAERVDRQEGHYELSAETGAVHFVRDKEEVDMKSAMNVAIGAKVSSFARTYILSKIREICHEGRMRKEFVYIDTDSIHAFSDYLKADAYALGGLKLEASCPCVKYIAPKTYCDVLEATNGKAKLTDLEVHSKGVTTKAVISELHRIAHGGTIDLSDIDKAIGYGQKYVVLVAMNVKGGKVLLPTEKYLATYELSPDETEERLCYSNYSGSSYLMEP